MTMAEKEDAWFAQKTFGYGSGLPIRWQGWAMIAVHIAIILAGLPMAKTHPAGFAIYAALMVAIAMPIYAAKTEGGWKWRWGAK